MADRLGDARRANGARIEAERRKIGIDNAAARRKIGTDNAAARNGSAVQDNLHSLRRDKPARPTLRVIEPRGVRPAKAGRADYKVPPVGSSGGIASPLEETNYTARTYWPERTLASVDGILSFRVKPLKTITQADASNAEVVQKFAEPPV